MKVCAKKFEAYLDSKNYNYHVYADDSEKAVIVFSRLTVKNTTDVSKQPAATPQREQKTAVCFTSCVCTY